MGRPEGMIERYEILTAHAFHNVDELPGRLLVFPLSGAVLFPRWTLPLNIFEPRYLNMIDDAMASDRLIGMVQTVGGDPVSPELANVGCVGRITSFSETDDGRYLISLSGVCRFVLEDELDVTTPYRQVKPLWSPYGDDLKEPSEDILSDRSSLVLALKRYTARNEMDVDWSAVETAPIETLINALCAGCPFSVMEKQALIEARDLSHRCQTLITLLDIDASGDDRSTLQ